MNSLSQSVLIHTGLMAICFVLIFLNSDPQIKPNTVEFKMIEIDKSQPTIAPEIKITKAIPKAEPVKAKNEVFGVSRKSLLNDGPNGVQVKMGNTLAKELDDKILNADDPDALPIPTEEYLVTKMPKLLTDIKIPYPPEAKKQGLTGQVIMDILIDQNGKVREAKLVRGPGGGLNEAAVSGIYSFRFKPARVGNQNAAVRIRYAINFVLE